MKSNHTIGIFTYARTGSNFLGELFATADNMYLSELFCVDYLQYFRKMSVLLRRIGVPSEIIRTFMTIYDRDTLFEFMKNYDNYTSAIAQKNIYSLQLLIEHKNLAYELDQNLVFKIFNEHFKNDITYETVIKECDYVIINFRKNVFASYLSYKKAMANDNWCKINCYHKSYLPQTNKFIWNKEEYLLYYLSIVQYIRNIYIETIRQNKKYMILSYEDTHKFDTFNDKVMYVYKKLKLLGITGGINTHELFLKQTNNDNENIEYIENIQAFYTDKDTVPCTIEYGDITQNMGE